MAGAFDEPGECEPLFDEPVWGRTDRGSQGLGFILETLHRHGQKATFFVETASVDHFGEQPMREVCERLTAADQDVQLHVHPCWRALRDDARRPEATVDDCADLEEAVLDHLISEGCERIERWTGRRPIALRTGNFSAGRKVYRAMARAGLVYSSNVCIGVSPPRESDLNAPDGLLAVEGIRELPATCFRDVGPVGGGRWRPMQITACSFSEMRALLEQAFAAGQTHLVLVTHPFEFIKVTDARYSSIRPNRLVQRRLRKICAYIAAAENSARFEMCSFSDLEESGLSDSDAHLAGSSWRSFLRAVQNSVNDRVFIV